jgi:hypothetical protein
MLRPWKILAVSFLPCFISVEPAMAAAPTVEAVIPGVGPRGCEFTVLLTGARLKGACGILFYNNGLALKRLDAVSDNEVKATLVASGDCRTGAHPLRLQTPGGLSEMKVVHISLFPVIEEVEPNDAPKAASAVRLGTTISGVIDAGDIDSFAVTLRKGERLAAEVEAIRLGGEMTDVVLTVIGPDGSKIIDVDDTLITKQDPFVSLVAPSDGRYILQIRDTAYGGGPSNTYAFHLGDFPRPKGIFPPGGQAGKDVRFKLLGAAADTTIQVVKLPNDTGPWWDYYPRLGRLTAPTPIPLRVRPYPCVDEADPAEAALPRALEIKPVNWPVAFHCVLARPGDVDAFAINGRAGQVMQVEVFAERAGSALDSIVEIYNPEGDLIGRNDDDACHDSRITFKAETSGAYRIEISDKRRGGGPAFLYRIEVDQPRPSLEIFLPSPVRKSQARQVIAVPKGNRVLAYLGVRRDGFDAPVRIEVSGLPKGVSLDVNEIPTAGYLTPIVIEAAADAPLGAALVRVDGAASTDGELVRGTFQQTVDLIPATGDSSYQSITVDRLALVVTEEAPYCVSLFPPKAPLVRDGAIDVAATVERAKGFEEPLEVTLPYLPPGVEMEGPIVLSAMESRAVFRLFARPDADPVSWRLAAQVTRASPRRDRRAMTIALQDAINQAAGGGTGSRRRRAPVEAAPEVASKIAPIEVSVSSISGRFEPLSVEQGQTVVLILDLDMSSPLVGSMEATLQGLPPRASAKPVKLTPRLRRLEFLVTVAATTPIGEHDSIVCRLMREIDGQVSVYQVGRGGVLKVVAPGALTRDANGRPLGRLEALRRKERRLAGSTDP